jgi:hypothetical protein
VRPAPHASAVGEMRSEGVVDELASFADSGEHSASLRAASVGGDADSSGSAVSGTASLGGSRCSSASITGPVEAPAELSPRRLWTGHLQIFLIRTRPKTQGRQRRPCGPSRSKSERHWGTSAIRPGSRLSRGHCQWQEPEPGTRAMRISLEIRSNVEKREREREREREPGK